MATFAKSTFSAKSYAAFRPTYPQSLYQTVLSYHQGPRNLCIDLGCGHGLVGRELSKSFASVIGTDPSKGMIAQARNSTPRDQYGNMDFREASAESLPFVEDGSVDMVVAGQAAHWFNYPKLFKELARTVRPGGTMAFWGYKDHVFVDFPKATQIMDHYCYGQDKDLLGSYWSQPGRSIVQNKLGDIKPPEDQWEDIQRIEYEPGAMGKGTGKGTMFMNSRMKVGQCKSYVRTWSSYHGWQETHPDQIAKDKGGNGDVIDEMLEAISKESPEFKDEDFELDIEWGSGLVMARKR
ncbi:hypothetical protein MBLNU459_g6297t1 [Dothideomycetes sp. NU459]